MEWNHVKKFNPVKYSGIGVMRIFVQQAETGKVDTRIINELAGHLSDFLAEYDNTDFTDRGADKKASLLKKHILGESHNRGRPRINKGPVIADFVDSLVEQNSIEIALESTKRKLPHIRDIDSIVMKDIENLSALVNIVKKDNSVQKVLVDIGQENLQTLLTEFPEELIDEENGFVVSSDLTRALLDYDIDSKKPLVEHCKTYLSNN